MTRWILGTETTNALLSRSDAEDGGGIEYEMVVYASVAIEQVEKNVQLG